MALRFTGSTSVGEAADASGDTWITLTNQYIASDTDAFSFAGFDNVEYILQGDLYSAIDGIVAESGSDNISVMIGSDASIFAVNYGIHLYASGEDDLHVVRNLGTITTDANQAIRVTTDNSAVDNAGTILSGNDGIFVGGSESSAVNSGIIASDDVGITMFSHGGTLQNTGTVTALENGLFVSGNDGTLQNAGTVVALENGIILLGVDTSGLNSGTVESGEIGLLLDGNGLTFANSGTILSGMAAVAFESDNNQSSSLVNSGTLSTSDISATGAAITGQDGNETILNTGLIQGDVVLGSGADTYNGRGGRLDGTLNLEGGNDTAYGGAEDNIVLGGGGSDEIMGRAGDDTLDGGSGDDDLYGGSGADTLIGDNGADILSGGTDDDFLDGGDESDTLYGGNGDDTLVGGGSGDTLHGGRGDDVMEGNGGRDTFVFRRPAGDDVILDFRDGTDTIDVSAFGLSGFAELSAAISDSDGDALINWSTLGGEGLLIVEGAAGELDATDFLF